MKTFKETLNCVPFNGSRTLSQISAFYEEDRKIMWMMLRAEPRPCFNYEVLQDILSLTESVKESGIEVNFWITGSLIPSIFNVGGDLNFFSNAIRGNKKQELSDYAKACVDCVYSAYTGFGVDAISIAMVEGTALGGGFEAALAHNFLLAQNNVKMGFPEVAFNLFPGMGGYSFVARKAGMKTAEDLIITGESHTAEWHKDKGIVDKLFDVDNAYDATREFIDTLIPKLNTVRATLRTRNKILPVTYNELIDIAEDWVESAFKIEESNLEYMERLVTLQNKRSKK